MAERRAVFAAPALRYWLALRSAEDCAGTSAGLAEEGAMLMGGDAAARER